MSVKNFHFLNQVGTGSFASVFRVKRLEDDQIYALKKVKLMALSQKEKENALNQIRILASVKSPHIIRYKQAFLDRQTASLCLVTQFADGGDLETKIQALKDSGKTMQESQIWHQFIQMVKALKALHSANIVHRDLKCANIFLFKDGRVKIGDMNVSKVLKQRMCETQTGTPYYASPQIWKDRPYDRKSDIWSLGCILYEILMLSPPFTGQNMEQLYKKVMRGIYPKIMSKYSKNIKNLVRMMLQIDSGSRPDASTIIQYMQKCHMKKLNIKVNQIINQDQDQFDSNRVTKQNRKNIIRTAKVIPSLHPQSDNQEENNGFTLIRTIKLPKKLSSVGQMLPKSNYQEKNYNQKERRFPLIKKKQSYGLLPSIERPLMKIGDKKVSKFCSQKSIPLKSMIQNDPIGLGLQKGQRKRYKCKAYTLNQI